MVSEERYHSLKREFLVLKWVICDHFKDYLFYASEFHVYTDYNPLTYIKTSSKVNSTGQRWINELASFNISIHYKPSVQLMPLLDSQLKKEILGTNPVKHAPAWE